MAILNNKLTEFLNLTVGCYEHCSKMTDTIVSYSYVLTLIFITAL